ncbi:MAG: hypothetical protein SOX84_04005 [Prevotella sp.]|nr:hypothetical protein [Prevotella sp.]MDY4217928.1 hypothetical protein [Prevotella sp.]
MTREEIRQKQIDEATSTSITETLLSTPNYEFSPRATDLLECAFTKGAEWADSHPASPWHSVADGDLPPRATGQYSNLVIILNEDEEMRLDYYDWKKHDWFSRSKNNDFNVIHWMEIPELPTKEFKI